MIHRTNRLAERLLSSRTAAPPFSLTTKEFQSALDGGWRAKQKALAWMKSGGSDTIPNQPDSRIFRVSQTPLTDDIYSYASGPVGKEGGLVWFGLTLGVRDPKGRVSKTPEGLFNGSWVYKRKMIPLERVEPFLSEIAEKIWAALQGGRTINFHTGVTGSVGFTNVRDYLKHMGMRRDFVENLDDHVLIFSNHSYVDHIYEVIHGPADVERILPTLFPLAWKIDPPRDADDFMRVILR